MSLFRVSSLIVVGVAGLLVLGCGRHTADAPPAPPVAPASTAGAAPPASTPVKGPASPTAKPAAGPFPDPENIGPRTFRVVGPFPNVIGAEKAKTHPGLGRDYLSSIGGETDARIDASTKVTWEGASFLPREGTLDARAALNLGKLFGGETDDKVAYAYAEWNVDKPVQALVLFGTDDGGAIWLNGRQVHRVAQDRALNPDSDRLELPLLGGANRVLVKIDNGLQAWGFALKMYDDEGRRRLQLLDVRRHIDRFEPRPVSGDYVLEQALPDLAWGDPAAAEIVFGKNPLQVRWFGPDLNPVESAGADGQYTALVEATTLDGYTYRHMVTFAKLPRQVIASVSAAASAIPVFALNRGGDRAAAKGEPAWLRGPHVRASEQQLLLRLKLEGRTPRPLAPPEAIRPKAPELKSGTEKQARVASGTVEKLRALAQDWAKADPNPFVVLVARHGVVFMDEPFNGFSTESTFFPASLAKSIGALTFARAVDQGLVGIDDPVSRLLPEWAVERTAKVTFRYCFYHLIGFTEHRSHGAMFNPYLDNALLVEDAAFTHPGTRYQYSGDSFNLAGKALELLTGQSIWRLLYENLERPFGEPVVQYDLGAGEAFNAMYLAKVGQMLLQDGRYGAYRFFSPGFLESLRPRRIADFVPEIDNKTVEGSIGLDWMPDPQGEREHGVMGPNVIGHGASSGSIWRVDLDHDLVVVIGRGAYKDVIANEVWTTKFMRILAPSLLDGAKPGQAPAER